MKISRHVLHSALAAALIAPASFAQAGNQSQAQTTPPTTTEANKAQTGTANEQRNPTTDPTDTTSRQQGRMPSAPKADTSNRSRTTSPTAGASGDMLTPDDRQFMMKTAEGGLTEVHLAQLAQQKASSESVKELAKTIEQDHTKANAELKRIAGLRNVDLPTAPPTMGPHKKDMDKLEKLSGADFDRAYLRLLAKEHRNGIKSFERQSRNGMDSDLKAFVDGTLPTLQNHLQMAQSGSTAHKQSGRTADTKATDKTTHTTEKSTEKEKK